MAESITQAVGVNNTSIGYVWFSFRGRISRSTYWLKYFLPWMGLYIALSFISAFAGMGAVGAAGAEADLAAATTAGFIVMIVSLVGLWPSLAAAVKRCHDRGRSGWFLLLAMIPLINLWVLVEVYFLRGTVGENKYGPDTVV